MKIRIYEQADKTGALVRYSWILDGVDGRRRNLRKTLEAAGWKYLRGGRESHSVYVTNDYATAAQTGPHVFGIKLTISSNGTHKIHNVPMYDGNQA